MDLARAAAVTAAFGLGEPSRAPAFVARGAMGEIWRVETDDGRAWAVKSLFEWAESDPRPPDLELQAAAAAAGIRLPAPRTAPDGRAVIDLARVYEWAELRPIERPFDDEVLAEAGTILGTLHSLALPPRPGEVVDEWYLQAPSADELTHLVDRARRAERPWAAALQDHLPRLVELAELVAESSLAADDVIVCHCDLTPDNVFRAAGGDALLVVDWENAGPLSAEAELGMTISSWAAPDRWRAFLDGYEAAGGPATLRGPASFATSVATVLNYLRVLVDHSLEDGKHRAFAEPQLEARLHGDGFDHVVPRGWFP